MRGVNKTITIGTLGADPEVKQFPNGGSITTISVAVSEQWNDKQTGERKENTEWLRIVFNNKLAEIAAQYLRKGSQVYIEGSLRTRKWTDSQGVERQITEIRADQMQMLGGKSENSQPNVSYPKTPQGQQYVQQAVANAPKPNYQPQPEFTNNMNGNTPQLGVVEDEVPF